MSQIDEEIASGPADAVDVKMVAHDLRVDALGNVSQILRQEIARLARFEADLDDFRQGSTLQPVRSGLVQLRQVQRALEPYLRQVAREARAFESSNFEAG
jgi:hypothetical protein